MLRTDFITRSVGSLSCVVGLLCYALSLSFKSLFGEWNPTKIVLYAILSSAITIVVLFANKCPVSGVFMRMLKAHVEFLVLMLTSLYSFFADRSMNGKPDTLSVVSSGAFALTSLCLSLQIKVGFQAGLFTFLLGCLTVQLMKIHFIFILVAIGFSYPLVILRSYPEPESTQNEGISQQVSMNSDAPVDANNASATQEEGIAEQVHVNSDTSADDQPLEVLIHGRNSATATQKEGISEQASVNSGASADDQPLEVIIHGPNSATATQKEGIIQQIAEGNEGSDSHGEEANGNEGEYGSVHENPNNSSGDQLVAHYKPVMAEAHEFPEEIHMPETLKRRGPYSENVGGDALRRGGGPVSNNVGGEELRRRRHVWETPLPKDRTKSKTKSKSKSKKTILKSVKPSRNL